MLVTDIFGTTPAEAKRCVVHLLRPRTIPFEALCDRRWRRVTDNRERITCVFCRAALDEQLAC
jgi:hypothetical protein